MNQTVTIQDPFIWQGQPLGRQFPALQQTAYGKPLVYLDNAATTQKPQVVIDAISAYYRTINSNIHRGVHFLSQQATSAYEASRAAVAKLIHAAKPQEIIFTRGTTEGINLVASSFGQWGVKPGDCILITAMEHHSNIVPWQILCEQRGATLRVIPMDSHGELIPESLDGLLDERVRLLAFTYISNSLGTVNPAASLIRRAHDLGIPVLVDAAQAIAHLSLNVQELDCDFLAFSGHKMYGPTGIGVLYGKESWLEKLPPYQGGGEMIRSVRFEKTEYNELPFKFEAGTPNIEGAICLKTAVDFLEELGLESIREYEQRLLEYATGLLSGIEGLRIIGTAREKSGALSFVVDGAYPYDIGVLLDKMGIAVRTGHHCTQPVMDFFGIPGTVRASLAVYNTPEEIEQLSFGLEKAIRMLR